MLMMLTGGGYWTEAMASCHGQLMLMMLTGGWVLDRGHGQLVLMPWPADAHDARGGWIVDKAMDGQLMLMMLVAAGLWTRPCQADAHDAYWRLGCGQSHGQLILMMLVVRGGGQMPWPADAHDARGGGVVEKAVALGRAMAG
ncbi:hypothetical protein AK812_SmicGene46373 [Symbiodinium microadriaticum]|uniref:Uncharacterized protein n=1 Tax=Symbiodinium microadriaticum TaxID=2951 RepID=A0A1Q9BU09_SYMMI|nr:hypothetical protein AK812_SmicGene46373 [Symbiodinium microadriaticum]